MSETRSSPPPPAPAAQTGGYSVLDHNGRPRRETTGERALRITLGHREQLGRPPPELEDSTLWGTLTDVRAGVGRLLLWTEAKDKAAASNGAVLARIGWRALETMIPLGIGWLLLWLSGWHR